MGRVRRNVIVGTTAFWALFDTGARNSYVVEEVAALLPTFPLEREERVALAGRVHQVNKLSPLSCLVEDLPIHVQARVLPEIGIDEQGKQIQVLLGALAMQEWGILPIPHQEVLDMSNYPREFVEFLEGATDS